MTLLWWDEHPKIPAILGDRQVPTVPRFLTFLEEAQHLGHRLILVADDLVDEPGNATACGTNSVNKNVHHHH